MDSINALKHCRHCHQLQVSDQDQSIYLHLVHHVPSKYGLGFIPDSGPELMSKIEVIW